MKLNLTKPLCFFDIESTGIQVSSDRIIDLSILKITPDGNEILENFRVNPGIPIPPESTLVHGISDNDVKNSPSFKEVAPRIAEFIGSADLAGYNSNRFDVPLLVEEFMRADFDFSLDNRKLIDVQVIFHLMEQRTLSAAYKFYCNKELVNAHQAEADVKATYEILLSQIKKYESVEVKNGKGELYSPISNDMHALNLFSNKSNTVDLIGRIVRNEKGQEVFNFGKHKDKPVTEVFEKEPSYYNWMMNGDFPLYTKKVITRIRLAMRAK